MIRNLLIIICLLLPNFLFSEDVGRIYSVDYPADTVINFGPCYVGDSITATFQIENISNTTYLIYEVMPTFGILRDPNEVFIDEFRNFKDIAPSFPINLYPQAKIPLVIQYNASVNLFTSPLGWYHSFMQVGFALPPDTALAYSQIFFLEAKKTNKFIDGFEDVLNFDSVYINPSVRESREWRVKSVQTDSVQLIEQKLTLLSQKLTYDEFFPQFYPVNPIFRKKNEIINWSFEYSPLDKGIDSALVELKFKPLPKDYPDSIQIANCKLYGTGVHQDIRLNFVNYDFRNDTIFVGNIRTNELVKINAQIKNFGNLAFGSLDEQITGINPNFSAQSIKKIKDNLVRFNQNETANFSLEFQILERGNFTLRYEITSDISQRNIKQVPASAEKVVFYITGKAIEPQIAVSATKLQFPVIYQYLPYCESSSDTTLLIRNIGNDTLYIKKIIIENEVPTFTFTTDENELTIPPNSSDSIIITFEPIMSQVFTADLLLISNSGHPMDSIRISLIGSSISPSSTSISIDSLKGKPGSILEIPIIVDSNIVYSSNFIDTLYYNHSILQYVGYKNQGTASEGAIENILISEDPTGYLAINIQKPSKSRFSNKPALINLLFKIYLGNAQSTLISFLNPRFGNEFCDYALYLPKENIRNGYFQIDSVGGIEMKAYPMQKPGIVIKSFSPNPVKDNINIGLSVSETTNLKLLIYDYYGNLIAENEFGKIGGGDFDLSQNFSNAPDGVYMLILQSEINSIYQLFIKY